MTRNEVVEKVKDVLVSTTGVPFKDIELESSLVNDLGVDELSQVELVLTLEDVFNVEISEDEADKLLCVADIVRFLLVRSK